MNRIGRSTTSKNSKRPAAARNGQIRSSVLNIGGALVGHGGMRMLLLFLSVSTSTWATSATAAAAFVPTTTTAHPSRSGLVSSVLTPRMLLQPFPFCSLAAASPSGGDSIKGDDHADDTPPGKTGSVATSTIREDIAAMKRQAAERLHRLESQMHELQRHQHDLKEVETRQVKHERIQQKMTMQQEEKTQQAQERRGEGSDATEDGGGDADDDSMLNPAAADTVAAAARISRPLDPHRYDRLEGTRWKLGFNLGREPGTWMPPDWGASGSRLYFEVVLDFLPDSCYDVNDEFFVGRAGCKLLKVKDAWMFPVGTGAASRGRRDIRVKPTGIYKVLPGQGPQGTDIVRMCFDVMDDNVVHDDVNCPVGRVYGTCGYFAIDGDGIGSVIPKSFAPSSTAHKDELAAEHRALLLHYEQLKLEDEQDPNFLHKLGRMQELFQVRRQLEEAAAKLQRERQVHPDKADLRFSRDGRVALSREGGVCRKVHKGLAIEYHILGRMEVASIRKDDDDDDDDDDDENNIEDDANGGLRP